MKLKTLKDITNSILPYCADKSELKAEAIKWVKKFSMKTKEGIEMSNVAGAFKQFFNIKTEDLKNE